MGWVVQESATGLTFQPEDEAGLAYALGRLRDDAKLRDALGRGGRKRFESHFRIEAVAQKMDACYREFLGHGR